MTSLSAPPSLSLSPDVIGVCKTVDEVTRLTTKANREVSKRTVHLLDMSGKLVTVTLWGEEVSARRGCHGEAVGTQVSRGKLESFSHPLIPIDPLQVGALIGFLRRSAGSRRLAPRASSNESDLF